MADWTETIAGLIDEAKGAQALKIGVVTAYSAPNITATIDDGPVEEIHRLAVAYPTPAPNDVVLFAVIRGTKAVQYVALGVIT